MDARRDYEAESARRRVKRSTTMHDCIHDPQILVTVSRQSTHSLLLETLRPALADLCEIVVEWSQELERLGHTGHARSAGADEGTKRLERGEVERGVGFLRAASAGCPRRSPLPTAPHHDGATPIQVA